MDYSILVLLGLIVLVVGVTYGTKYLRKNNVVQADDLDAAVKVLGITLDIADELKLRDEKKIKIISDVITLTTRYIQQSLTKITQAQALDYAITLAEQFGLEITPARVEILSDLLGLAMAKIEEQNPEPIVETIEPEKVEEVVEEKKVEEVVTPNVVKPAFEDTSPKTTVEENTTATINTDANAVVPEFTEK